MRQVIKVLEVHGLNSFIYLIYEMVAEFESYLEQFSVG